MNPTIDIIVLGHLSHNPFWNEEQPIRPPVATTTLIRCGGQNVLVDPSLPGDMLAARLHERSGLKPDAIDVVFLTSFHPTHRRGLELFDDARWLIGPVEREAVAAHLNQLLEGQEPVPTEVVEAELAIIGRTEPAEDAVAPAVDLFPSPGVTPGLCGLLVAGLKTTVIAGDAVLTRDHVERNRVADGAVDPQQAAESLAEIFEVADVVIPGHDNLVLIGQGI